MLAEIPKYFKDSFVVVCPDEETSHVRFKPVVSNLARKTLAHLTGGQLEDIRESWSNRHDMVRHSDAVLRLGIEDTGPTKLSHCRIAGRCLCSGSGKIQADFVAALNAVLRAQCMPKTAARRALANACVVLCLVPQDS